VSCLPLLKGAKLVAFAATTDAPRAAAFYTTVLGLKLRYEDDFAVSLDSGGVEVRLQKVERFTPQPFTTLGWQAPSGARVVWFRDPDGNLLSVAQYAAG
jgi:catechol 2,3-dioxygenase-like lactoylglutathione lyase family enzyme